MIPEWNDGLRNTANSELRTFKRCRRKWWFGYYMALTPVRPETSGARALGTKLHIVFAGYYNPDNTQVVDSASCLVLWNELIETDTVLLQAYSETKGYDPAEELKNISKDNALGRAMIEGYFEWLEETGEDSDLRITGAEESVRVKFNESVALIAKLDLRVLRRSDGARLFMDHKSCDNFTVPIKVADLDEQFKHYSLMDMLIHKAQGDDPDATFVDGGIFNFIRKVKRTKAAKPPFFKRHEVRHNRETLLSYWYRLVGQIADVTAVEDALKGGADHRMVAYANPTRDCHWDCDFFRVCGMADDTRSDLQGILADAYTPYNPLARYYPEDEPDETTKDDDTE